MKPNRSCGQEGGGLENQRAAYRRSRGSGCSRVRARTDRARYLPEATSILTRPVRPSESMYSICCIGEENAALRVNEQLQLPDSVVPPGLRSPPAVSRTGGLAPARDGAFELACRAARAGWRRPARAGGGAPSCKPDRWRCRVRPSFASDSPAFESICNSLFLGTPVIRLLEDPSYMLASSISPIACLSVTAIVARLPGCSYR